MVLITEASVSKGSMLLLLLSACTTTSEDTGWMAGIGPVSLMDASAWTLTSASDDPWPSHRPESVDCSPLGWFVESGGIEVDTTECNYFSAAQPLPWPVGAGSPVHVEGWNAPQVLVEEDDEPLVHMALTLDGELFWEQEVEVPSSANVFSETFSAPFTAEAGTTLVLHLHNHGYNTWNLHSLERVAP